MALGDDVDHNDGDLLAWKISREAFDWAQSEQSRLQGSTGQPLSQEQLFDRMRSAYEAAECPINLDDLIVPSRHQTLVEEFVRLLEDGSPKFRAFRETVIGVLSDRLDAGHGVPVE